MRVTRDISSLD
jgi:hypothetical protein